MSELSPLDPFPSMKIAQARESFAVNQDIDSQQFLMEQIRENRMGPFYQLIAKAFGWQIDPELAASLEIDNATEFQKLTDELAKARENQSEEDVRLAYQNLALFSLRIGDNELSKKHLQDLYKQTVALGQKIDVIFCQMRLAFFFQETSSFNELLDLAKTLIKEGGDWERKNRLKIYEGLYLCTIRNFIAAAPLFISTLSTFTAVELMEYPDFVYRVVLLGVLSLDRANFGSKIDHAMEVRAAEPETIELTSLYHLDYATFFTVLAKIQLKLRGDLWFKPHLSYLIKELRVKAYRQYLEPYQSVQIAAMAASFNVSPEFIENEVRRFIFSLKINARIDRTSMTIITNPPDSRVDLMRTALRKIEYVMARLQKLGRILSA